MLSFGLSSISFSSLMQECTCFLSSPVVSLGLCLLGAVLFRQWYQSQSLKLPTPPPKGGAALYPLAWVYRNEDEWWGGLKALQRDTSRTAYYKPLREFLDGTSDEAEAAGEMKEKYGAAEHSRPSSPSFVIYCLDFETQSVVFMEMEPGANLLEEPFMDRGVRHLAGKHVLVASFDTVEDYLREKEADEQQQQGRGDNKEHFLWVWNTGRCGSTLLHRLLLATGRVCSLSEPYWCEQLGRARAQQQVKDVTLRRLLRLCLLVDAQLLRQASQCPPPSSSSSSSDSSSLPHITSLNMKGMGHHLLDLVLEEFPASSPSSTSKHLYLYRDVVSVVESLASVFYTASFPFIRACLWACPRWTLDLVTPYRSQCLQAWIKNENLELTALGRVGRWGAARELSLAWLDSVCTWLEVMEGKEGGEGGKAKRAVERAVLKMEDFVDSNQRDKVVQRVLFFVFGKGVKEAVTKGMIDKEKCLAVFGRHSQQGSRMQQSSNVTGKLFLTEAGQIHLRALLSSVPDWRVRTMRLPCGLLDEEQRGRGGKKKYEEFEIGEKREEG